MWTIGGLWLWIAMVPFPEPSLSAATECDIAGIYERIAAGPGTLALTAIGEAEEIEALLVPTRVEAGRYRVSVSRVGSNLYEAVGGGLYFRTRYCYEYATYQEVVADITSAGGFSRGSIDFDPRQ